MAGMRGREGGFPPRDEHPREKATRSIFGENISFNDITASIKLKMIVLVFSVVANIAFETTEEQLRTVLSEVGPVVNLK